MIPAVAIAQERDPFAIGRRLRAAVGVAVMLQNFSSTTSCRTSLAAGDVDERGGAALEVGRCAIDDEMARVEPAPGRRNPPPPATSSSAAAFPLRAGPHHRSRALRCSKTRCSRGPEALQRK